MRTIEYFDDIKGWDWKDIIKEAKRYPQLNGDGLFVGYSFLGTVFALTPSGKYYTPWACSNVTLAEAEEDKKFYKALDDVADENGGWIEQGPGDPCDLFFATILDMKDVEKANQKKEN